MVSKLLENRLVGILSTRKGLAAKTERYPGIQGFSRQNI